MSNVKILDCTLRDGGRIIDCNFGLKKIKNIVNDLRFSGIDIIEVGFIRDKIAYQEGTTFFTELEQINFLEKSLSSEMVVFVDHGMFNVDSIPERCDDDIVSGIRVGFTKDYARDTLPEIENLIKKGYKVFVQPVNILNYSDDEIVDLIHIINKVKPYAFAIVDTYGAMYREDLTRIFDIYNRELSRDILIDFHSHNNYQLSFSHAQNLIQLAAAVGRDIIIDATLYGMGKVAGNLNTELITEYLNRRYGASYDISRIFDSIDENILPYLKEKNWGYSLNALLSGKYKSHPNNVIYLTEKFKLDTNDVENI